MRCDRCGKDWPSVIQRSHPCEERRAFPEPRAGSQLYEPTEEQAYHSPTLAACRRAGLSESQTIEMLWRAHRDLQWRMMRMVENEASPRFIVMEPKR